MWAIQGCVGLWVALACAVGGIRSWHTEVRSQALRAPSIAQLRSLHHPPGLILSVVMALSFLALVVLVVMPPPPALAEPPGSSIWSEDSGGPTS